ERATRASSVNGESFHCCHLSRDTDVRRDLKALPLCIIAAGVGPPVIPLNRNYKFLLPDDGPFVEPTSRLILAHSASSCIIRAEARSDSRTVRFLRSMFAYGPTSATNNSRSRSKPSLAAIPVTQLSW